MSVSIVTPSPALQWNGTLTVRSSTNRVIFHHAAMDTASVHDMHNYYLDQGQAGIGYNFYIRKDGTIYEGRGWNKVGAHTVNFNSTSIGICCEGYYHNDEQGYTQAPPKEQIKSLIALIAEAKNRYTITSIGGHSDFNATVCPGSLFPESTVIEAVSVYPTIVAACNALVALGVIRSPEYWLGYFWCLPHLGDLIISCANRCRKCQTGLYMSESAAIQRLADVHIISSPDYWLKNYASIEHLGDFLKQVANRS